MNPTASIPNKTPPIVVMKGDILVRKLVAPVIMSAEKLVGRVIIFYDLSTRPPAGFFVFCS